MSESPPGLQSAGQPGRPTCMDRFPPAPARTQGGGPVSRGAPESAGTGARAADGEGADLHVDARRAPCRRHPAQPEKQRGRCRPARRVQFQAAHDHAGRTLPVWFDRLEERRLHGSTSRGDGECHTPRGRRVTPADQPQRPTHTGSAVARSVGCCRPRRSAETRSVMAVC